MPGRIQNIDTAKIEPVPVDIELDEENQHDEPKKAAKKRAPKKYPKVVKRLDEDNPVIQKLVEQVSDLQKQMKEQKTQTVLNNRESAKKRVINLLG